MLLEQKNKIILVADDDSEDQELLEEAFLEADPSTKTDMVFNGKAAIEYLENCESACLPCAIILDYSMPFLSGAQVLAVICKNARYDAIPKFIWSTSSSHQHIVECLNMGAINYFVKPDSPHKLFALAKEILAACEENNSAS